MARRDAAGPRLITRNVHDFSERFPFIKFAIGALPARSCLIDGEAKRAVARPGKRSSPEGPRRGTRLGSRND
jgi:ATP-dependent DNA ligase